MSNHLTSLAYKVDAGSLLRKAVLVLLADKASDDGSGIWASKQTMADELNCSKQAIINTMQQFIEEGLLVEDGRRPCRTGYTLIFKLNVRQLAVMPRVKRWAEQSTTLTGQPGLPVNPVDTRGQPGLPKPPLTTPKTSRAKALSVAREFDENDRAFMRDAHDWAVANMGWSLAATTIELDRFIDSAKAHGRRYKDWMAAWRSWCRSPFCKTKPLEDATAYRREPMRV